MSDEAGAAVTGSTADQLRATWRRRSMASCWACPDDWWVPAVDAVAESAVHGRRMDSALALLGRARAQAGVGIGETLDDLGELYGVLGTPEPPLPSIRALAVGWSEGGLTASCATSCEDPLTGLVTLAYLRTRLTELYREASTANRSAGESHCLIVVDIDDRADPWRRVARTLLAGQDLRAAFIDGETLALLAPGRVAALAYRQPDLEPKVAGLRRTQARGTNGRVWIEDLPVRLEQALRLLDGLVR